ncbi:uncharacterized protein LOC134542811 [Bacillus rossius redtenbacheri]|uniref:uncharacterized protein LOC134542811 n=1 Tax=Bacillus rossius redtenbacheri TaxID=93214 RepID=UPI002FDCD3AA
MTTIKEILYGTQPVFRRNFIQENMKHLRDMQNFHSNKLAGIPTERSNNVRCQSSKPRSKSSQPRGRDQTARTSTNRNDRPATSVGPNVAKKQLDVKATCRRSAGTLPVNRAKSPAAKCVPQIENIILSRKLEPFRTNRQGGSLVKCASCKNLVAGKERDHEAVSLTRATTYKDGSSQTLDTHSVEEIYKEGVVVYSSFCTLTKERLALEKPTRVDSAIQTDKDHSSVGVCVNSQDFPTDQNPTDPVDQINIQEIIKDDCKENIQDHRGVTVNSRKSSAKQKSLSTPKDSSKPPASYRKGVVPRYLRERQQQWQKAIEEELANTPDPSCPPGHVLLPEEERKQTLAMINRDYARMVQELNMMPVRTDTLRTRQRKIELEQKLTKLEEASKVFSRPKVFVKVGE